MTETFFKNHFLGVLLVDLQTCKSVKIAKLKFQPMPRLSLSQKYKRSIRTSVEFRSLLRLEKGGGESGTLMAGLCNPTTDSWSSDAGQARGAPPRALSMVPRGAVLGAATAAAKRQFGSVYFTFQTLRRPLPLKLVMRPCLERE